ncbi:alpha-amylase family glycosyl hydrolase [Herbiconiux ginsengi]|uniref:Glycosidase n=1 Tax=Herbiconiux ginsengi TaxID=381665 RepID=A0A1H3JG61_9MICO|nr:alpha-amylase family glycosyl hydrolase [Herbiconiux ginsengi]SDY38973.1 Glycosidase [Herbiconiux ginsengi]
MTDLAPSPHSIPWADHAIWWQVYPLGFVGADLSGERRPGTLHRLSRLLPWLDDLVALGANGLLLGPVFDSATHGYDTVDHLRIDPRLGGDADIDALLAACRERGIRVLFDGAFNHVGRAHPWWQEAVAAGPGSVAAGRFSTSPDAVEVDGLRVDVFEGHDALVVLDHEHPDVVALAGAVMAHWLERGIDGWRLDAAYAVPPAFWRACIDPLRARFADAWFVGEVIHGDYVAYVEESGLDSVTQYELWSAIRGAISSRNWFELAWSLKRHDEFSAAFLPLTFIGNHDVTRIASAIDDERHLGHAIAVLMFVAGTPSIYSGDERGLHAVKEERAGGDDAIRPEFPLSPTDWPGGPVFELYRQAIAFRRRHAWLAHARVTAEELSNEAVLLVATGRNGERAALALNLADEPRALGGAAIAPNAWEFRETP